MLKKILKQQIGSVIYLWNGFTKFQDYITIIANKRNGKKVIVM